MSPGGRCSAADVAISMTFGVCSLQSFKVWTDEIKSLAA